ncbi:MAG TPA: adenylate/guanylate cyclase domain-containing protein [Thermoanaerobaculia bacterium]|nr:adenylate/guanylate cyclase domain-containing protein [Thermoanaerobaculia bacterium]
MKPALGLGLAAALLALLLQGWLRPVELVATDLLMRLRGPQPADPRITIVDIDETGIDGVGRWPWRRIHMARLIDRLKADGARVIALDAVFSEPSLHDADADLSGDDRALAESIRRAGNVVLGYFFRQQAGSPPPPGALAGAAFNAVFEPPEGIPIPRRRGVEANLPLFARAAAAQGFFSHEREGGVLRHYSLAVRHGGGAYPPLALRAAGLFLGQSELTLASQSGVAVIEIAGRAVHANERGELWVNYRGPRKTYPTVSAAHVLNGTFQPGTFRDRLVLVGLSESGLADLQASPFGEMPGVEVHANVADDLLNGTYIRDTGMLAGLSLAALVLLALAVALLVLRTERHLTGALLAAALVLAWPVLAYWAFVTAGWHLQAVSPVLAGSLALVGSLRYRVATEEARAQRIKQTFQHYVSGAVVDEMLRHPERVKLGGERRQMTVLFSDIRGFTSISETLDPEALVQLLNELFTPMTRIVLDHGGTLDKYMGDALMAFFGAPLNQPDHAARACRATLAMRDELVRLNAGWHATGKLPPHLTLGIGIGLNSGEMSVGNVGSEAVFGYTVIGDNVNLGSRIEGLNKDYGTQILVSESTREAAGDGLLFRELDWVRVKGKLQPVGLHELLATLPAAADDTERAETFARGLALYRAQSFVAAAETFAALADRLGDGPAKAFLERCRHYQEDPPPADWDGVEVRKTK